MSKPINMRRCVVCRQVRHKSELIRVVKTLSGEISFDETGKIFGRGAYVCKSATCAASLKKRRNFDKVFKTKLPNEFYDKICAAVDIKENNSCK
ncbi:MAG: YlxR family protein [Selenomonadaceae bacterium]|nr:YlxR family protein [Selenomonadaceae bacterium]